MGNAAARRRRALPRNATLCTTNHVLTRFGSTHEGVHNRQDTRTVLAAALRRCLENLLACLGVLVSLAQPAAQGHATYRDCNAPVLGGSHRAGVTPVCLSPGGAHLGAVGTVPADRRRPARRAGGRQTAGLADPAALQAGHFAACNCPGRCRLTRCQAFVALEVQCFWREVQSQALVKAGDQKAAV